MCSELKDCFFVLGGRQKAIRIGLWAATVGYAAIIFHSEVASGSIPYTKSRIVQGKGLAAIAQLALAHRSHGVPCVFIVHGIQYVEVVMIQVPPHVPTN
jgi:hypothetical protein